MAMVFVVVQLMEAREARLEAQLWAAEENRRLLLSMGWTPAEVTPTRSPGAEVPAPC